MAREPVPAQHVERTAWMEPELSAAFHRPWNRHSEPDDRLEEAQNSEAELETSCCAVPAAWWLQAEHLPGVRRLNFLRKVAEPDALRFGEPTACPRTHESLHPTVPPSADESMYRSGAGSYHRI
jgi:hypothetical protein